MQDVTAKHELSGLVGRYRIEARLAHGGMGEVYRVESLANGKRMALKRLFSEHKATKVARMFEREYHTLAGLAHPRIIEVYEYGLANGVPYYTMELLDGKDLRELAPMPYRTACRYLHEIASSLVLLHARKLLHRDLSPRNVRVTGDGRCKLIDFGALASFGVCDSVVGTPPLVPPEALHRAPLDQRADLYALGALAYWMLTGRHAFPVSALSELPAAWRRRPPRPSEVVAARDPDGAGLEAIPAVLDDLVMSLLTIEPLGRPATAAEVMDRFGAIGGLELDREAVSAQGYLRSPALVGRDRELARLDELLRATSAGHGSSVAFETTPGMGASRLLGELTLRAQLAGVTPLLIDAKLHRGPYGVVHDLIAKLLDALPEDAAHAATEHGPLLARFSSQVARTLAIAPDATPLAGIPGELRRRTQNALVQWLVAIAARRPLLILVDHLHCADEGSTALLAGLATAAPEHALALVVAHEHREGATHGAALKAVAAAGRTKHLRPLTQAHVQTLVRSLFGAVDHTARLADWLHGLSGGNPQACMDLVQHLVERDVVRYADGTWVLPQELRPAELPASLDQVVATRLARLSEAGRKLAEAASVRDGALTLSRCLEIASAEGIDNAYGVIDELVREGVLVQAGESYHFSHESVRERLLARLSPERVKRVHAQLGALLSQNLGDDVHAMLDAGWHLLHGGREAEGAELLAKAGIALGYLSDEMPAAVAPLTAALGVFRKQGRSKYELIRLLGPLTLAGYYCDRRLAEAFGDETVAMLEDILGLRIARRLRPWLGRKLALYVGLGSAAARFSLPGRGGIAALRKTITLLANCITCLVGTSTICFQRDRARRIANTLEPLSALGEDHAASWTHRFTCLLSTIPEDRQAETIAGMEQLLARLDDPRPIRDMPDDSRQMMTGGVMYALGALESFRGGHRAAHYADRLDALGIRLYMMVAAQVRANYHALRGESEIARTFRERVEMFAVQSGSGWQVEVWAPCSMILAQVVYRDRIGLKHTMETLDRLACEIPSLERHAKLARAGYYGAKGDHRASEALRRSVLDAAPPRGHVGWAASLAAHAQSVRNLGEAARARDELLAALSLLGPKDLGVVVMTHQLHVELALSYAELGQLDEAAEVLDEALRVYADCDGPMVLGHFHGARAQVAARAGDLELAMEHLDAMERYYRPTANPCLIAQCEALRRELARSTDVRQRMSLRPPPANTHNQDQELHTLLRARERPSDRADCALGLLLEETGGTSGFVYVLEDEQLRLLSRLHEDGPPDELEHELRAAIGCHAVEETTVHTGPAISTVATEQSAADDAAGSGFRIFVLTTEYESTERVIGAAAITRLRAPLRTPNPRLTRAIAEALSEQTSSA